MEKIVNIFDKKNAKITLPSSHSAAMNSEFMAAWGGGRGGGIYRGGLKAPVGAINLVLIVIH